MQEEPPVASATMSEANAAAVVLAQRILAGDRSAEDELVSTYRRAGKPGYGSFALDQA